MWKFSDRMAQLEYVNEEALRLGDEKIGVEHLMLGIIREGEGTAVRTLNVLGLEMGDLKRIIEEIVSVNKSKTLKFNSNEKGLTKQTKNILDKCLIELQSTDEKKIKTIHILLSIMRDKNNIVFSTLNKLRLDYDKILETYLNIQDKYSDKDDQGSSNDDDLFEEPKKEKVPYSKNRSKTPTLDNFEILTFLAEENKLDPIVGRHKEIERVSQILSKEKNNPILIGGRCRKVCYIEGLA